MTILELLETHGVVWDENTGKLMCSCREHGGGTGYRAHLAEVLEAHQREQQARAWSDGFHKGRKTENGSHVSTWPRNPYRTNQPKEAHDGR